MNVLNRVTLETLKKNKVRTAVTVIGVILSAAMITAVASLVTSMQNYMVEYEISHSGNWHVSLDNLDEASIARLESDDRVERLDWVQNIGFAELDKNNSSWRPYLKVIGFSDQASETLPVRVTRGRLPENDREIVISDYVSRIARVQYELGEEITLTLGQRKDENGEPLKVRNSYTKGEVLTAEETRTYTVVGYCENPDYEPSDTPGYAAITFADADAVSHQENLSLYLRLKSPKEAYTLLRDYGNSGDVNSSLLLYLNVSRHNGFYQVLYGMGSILMILILIGSVSLIYNAFSISISERTRQFGILSSVGATKKQLAASVRFEAFAVGLIGVPLGIGSGLLGAWVTLTLLSDKFTYLAGEGTMHLHVTWQGLVIALLITCLSLILSAWAPARRASRMSAMDAIRQTQDIVVRPQKRRTGRLAYRLFGLPGMLAAKNFKRNRRSYRSTVISLFLSVVLFLSASSFVQYLGAGVTRGTGTSNYDLEYYSEPGEDADAIYQSLRTVPGVKTSSSYLSGYFTVWLDQEILDPGLAEQLDRAGSWDPEGSEYGMAHPDQAHWNLRAVFLENGPFQKYVEEQGLDPALFLDPENPQGIAVNQYTYYDGENDVYRNLQVLDGQTPLNASIQVERYTKEGKPLENEEWTLTIGAFVETPPFGINVSSYTRTVFVLYPESVREAVVPQNLMSSFGSRTMQFTADDADKVYDEMNKVLEQQHGRGSIYNRAADEKSMRDMLEIINVFSYGFIVLISLIAVANVFHTISTNLHLRRREFAMLESVGMTEKGLRKMMYYECLCYGGKSLLYGLPAAFCINYLLYLSMGNGVEVGFKIPWGSLAVSVGSVFLVVIATMLYAMGKLKKESTVEILKQENG